MKVKIEAQQEESKSVKMRASHLRPKKETPHYDFSRINRPIPKTDLVTKGGTPLKVVSHHSGSAWLLGILYYGRGQWGLQKVRLSNIIVKGRNKTLDKIGKSGLQSFTVTQQFFTEES